MDQGLGAVFHIPLSSSIFAMEEDTESKGTSRVSPVIVSRSLEQYIESSLENLIITGVSP